MTQVIGALEYTKPIEGTDQVEIPVEITRLPSDAGWDSLLRNAGSRHDVVPRLGEHNGRPVIWIRVSPGQVASKVAALNAAVGEATRELNKQVSAEAAATNEAEGKKQAVSDAVLAEIRKLGR